MPTNLSVRISDDLNDRLEEYRNQHTFRPDKSDVVRRALTEFLDRELDLGDSDSD